MYDKLVTNVNAISNSGFVLKIQYSANKSGYKNEIMIWAKNCLILVDLLK